MPESRKRRIAVFLGAGASKTFGFPLTNSILTGIWHDLTTGAWTTWPGLTTSGRKGTRKELRPRAHASVKTLRRLLEALLPGLSSRDSLQNGASIIDVISLLDQMLLQGTAPTPTLSEDDIRTARATLQVALNAALRGTQKLSVRDKFVAWLLSSAVGCDGSRVSVISTNYDTLVEQKIFNVLKGLSAPIGRNIDFGISWRDCFRDEMHQRPPDASLAIFKLHGSLNWLRCESCGHISMNVRQRIATLEFWRKVVTYNECFCGGRLRSLLVTPSVVRDIRDPNLLSVWNAAQEDLRRAHEWILIGYSLPSEDIAIRSLLLRAFSTRSNSKSLRIKVIQWEPRPPRITPTVERSRYELFFPQDHLKDRDYETGGLEEFVRHLEPLAPRMLDQRLKGVLTRRA